MEGCVSEDWSQEENLRRAETKAADLQGSWQEITCWVAAAWAEVVIPFILLKHHVANG